MAIWYGKQANVVIGSTISPGTTSSLYAQVTGSGTISSLCKDLTITPGEAGVDALNVFGTQIMEESRPDLVNADFTMVFSDASNFASLTSWATVAASTGYVRYQGGDYTGGRSKRAIAFQVAQAGVGTTNVLMNNAVMVNQGEISLAADGSAEQTMSAACLVSDFYVEDNF